MEVVINPDVGKVVTTHMGKRAYRAHCKKIQGSYFLKNEECFEVNGLWYRADTGIIIFDHSNQKWVLKSKAKNMINGIVDFKDKLTPVMGSFTPNLTDVVTVIDNRTGNTYKCISAEVAQKYCVENISTGTYMMNLGTSSIAGLSKIFNRVDNKQKGYNIEDNADEYRQKIETYNAYCTPVNRYVAMYSKLLGDISFGMEAECIRGYLPEHIQYRNGIVICRDGSLHDPDGTQGPEYTSIPMSGAKGVQSIINFGKEATPRNVIDKHCAFHYHLGNLPTSRTFMVCLYQLCHQIQDEVFTMFPHYKIDEKRIAGKDKNYCKKLSRLSMFPLRKGNKATFDTYIHDKYVRIFTFLSNGFVPSREYNRKLGQYPKGGDKWNRLSRYYWVNFMNIIFSKRNTVEFRIHQGTTNPQKMVTWLFICNAIVKTAMCRTKDILKGTPITFDDVLDYYGTSFGNKSGKEMSAYLKEYVKERKAYFKKDYDNGNYMSLQELEEDKNFFFNYTTVSEMFR